MNVTLTLDRGTIDVPWARREVLALIADASVPTDPQTVALVVTELVTNAVIHGGTPVELRLAIQETRLRIEVRDSGDDDVPTEPTPPELTESSGRGLMIVDSMVDRWGVETVERGKVVLVEFGGADGDALDDNGPTTRSARDVDVSRTTDTTTEASQGTPSTRVRSAEDERPR